MYVLIRVYRCCVHNKLKLWSTDGYTEDNIKFVFAEESSISMSNDIHAARFSLDKVESDSCTSVTSTGTLFCLVKNTNVVCFLAQLGGIGDPPVLPSDYTSLIN